MRHFEFVGGPVDGQFVNAKGEDEVLINNIRLTCWHFYYAGPAKTKLDDRIWSGGQFNISSAIYRLDGNKYRFVKSLVS